MIKTIAHRTPIRSTWRDPIGPLLTDSRILTYQAEGRYTPEMQAYAKGVLDARSKRQDAGVQREKRAKRIRREYV